MKTTLGIAGAGLVLLACCAGPALIIGAIIGVGLSGLIGGISAALIVVAGAVCLLIVRSRRRKCSRSSPSGAESKRPRRPASEEN